MTWDPGHVIGNGTSCAKHSLMAEEWGGCYSEFEQEISVAVVDGGAVCPPYPLTGPNFAT